MTAEPVAAGPAPAPAPGTPREVRAALLAEEVGQFDSEWRAAMSRAAETLDLAEVYEVLDRWRLIARITLSDPDTHRRMLRKAEERLAGGPPPTGSVDEMRSLIRRRLDSQVYRIVPDDEVTEQVEALPTELLLAYAEVLDLLELAPWSGEPYHSGKPGGAMRRVLFGAEGRGVVIYLIFEDQQRVDLLRVYWTQVVR